MKTVNGFNIPTRIDEPGNTSLWRNIKLMRKIDALESTLTKLANGELPVGSFGTSPNLTTFDSDGYMQSTGDATAWDDLRFPATKTRQGIAGKPDFDYTEVGLLFPQNDTDEKIYINAQMPHAYLQGSNLRPHVHWIQDSSDVSIWKLSYRWYNNGAAVPSFTTITTDAEVFTYTSGSILQISTFPEIDGTDKNLSSFLDMIIYRDDNDVTGDVLFKEFDIHYEIDGNGSKTEFTKP